MSSSSRTRTTSVRDLNANECRKDGLKSKSLENVHVRKCEGKLRNLAMVVGTKLIEFAGNFTLLVSNASGDMKAFSFISDITNEKLGEFGVWCSNSKGISMT